MRLERESLVLQTAMPLYQGKQNILHTPTTQHFTDNRNSILQESSPNDSFDYSCFNRDVDSSSARTTFPRTLNISEEVRVFKQCMGTTS